MEKGQPHAGSRGEQQLVVFRLCGEEYGIPIQQVREIIRVPEITVLPRASAHIEGVINLRGDVLPIINLRRRLGLPLGEHVDSTRIIVLELPIGEVGLIVDAVTEVLRIPEELIQPAPSHVKGLRSEWLAGIGKLKDRLLILLDLDYLVTTEDTLLPQEAGESAVEDPDAVAASARAHGPASA